MDLKRYSYHIINAPVWSYHPLPLTWGPWLVVPDFACRIYEMAASLFIIFAIYVPILGEGRASEVLPLQKGGRKRF